MKGEPRRARNRPAHGSGPLHGVVNRNFEFVHVTNDASLVRDFVLNKLQQQPFPFSRLVFDTLGRR